MNINLKLSTLIGLALAGTSAHASGPLIISDETGVLKLYGEVGIIDPASLETNESQRAALFGKLCEIEPELH